MSAPQTALDLGHGTESHGQPSADLHPFRLRPERHREHPQGGRTGTWIAAVITALDRLIPRGKAPADGEDRAPIRVVTDPRDIYLA